MTATPPNHIRRRVVFHGRVQGVFFRATTRELAAGLDVVGYVRNLPDGTVELEAEGSRDQVTGLIDAISRRYAGNITHRDETDLAPRGDEQAFEIRY